MLATFPTTTKKKGGEQGVLTIEWKCIGACVCMCVEEEEEGEGGELVPWTFNWHIHIIAYQFSCFMSLSPQPSLFLPFSLFPFCFVLSLFHLSPSLSILTHSQHTLSLSLSRTYILIVTGIPSLLSSFHQSPPPFPFSSFFFLCV